MKIAAIIQARMSSTRLPGKVLMDLNNNPVIWHIWKRLRSVSDLDEIIVATGTERENDILEKYLSSVNISCFRGNENDVLDRFYQTAKAYNIDTIIRITADCPLIDPGLISNLISEYINLRNNIDYVALATGAGVFNQRVNKFPDGTDAEIFSFVALKTAWKESSDPLDRGESVTSYIWRNKDLFRCKTIYCYRDLGHLRWTLDNEDDLIFVRKIYKKLYNSERLFSVEDVINLLEDDPSILKINKHMIGKENYENYYIK